MEQTTSETRRRPHAIFLFTPTSHGKDKNARREMLWLSHAMHLFLLRLQLRFLSQSWGASKSSQVVQTGIKRTPPDSKLPIGDQDIHHTLLVFPFHPGFRDLHLCPSACHCRETIRLGLALVAKHKASTGQHQTFRIVSEGVIFPPQGANDDLRAGR